MRVIIIGCGRVGARTAAALAARGEHVTVVDLDPRAFKRLPSQFGGDTVRGNGTDEDVLRAAGAEQADILMALTEGDNRNALAAQVGKHTFGIPRVITKINDPLRGETYRALGLETISRTVILADALVTAAIEGAEATNGFVAPPTAEPLQGAPAPGTLAADEARQATRAPATDDGPAERRDSAGGPAAAADSADEPSAPADSVVQPHDGRDGGLG